MRCLDVPQTVDRKLIKEIGEDVTSSLWRQVLKAIPGKTALFILKSLGINQTIKTPPESLERTPGNKLYQSMISGNFTVEALTTEEERNLKAVKADNAEVPIKLWNNKIVRGISSDKQDHAL